MVLGGMTSGMSPAKKLSYLIFFSLVFGVVFLRLGNVTLAGLFSFMVLDLAHRKLAKKIPETAARWCAIAAFLVIAALVVWLFWVFIRLALLRLPTILAAAIPRVDELALQHGVELPFENLGELRAVLLDELKTHVQGVTQASSLLGRGFFQVLVGIFVAVLCFMSDKDQRAPGTFFEVLRKELDARMDIFMRGFEKIFGAQVVISFINTGITALFLLSMGMPYVHFLTLATFIFGIIPIVGTVISNTMVVGTALTVSPQMALLTFAFLILMHKAQYFLSSQIMGSRINTPVWQILLGLLIGEAVLGVPGMILAPAMLHYLREELQALPASPR